MTREGSDHPVSDLGYTAAFNMARLDEDKATVEALMFASRFVDGEPDFTGRGGPAAEEHWKRFDPARMLRDVSAGRTIVAACTRAAEADPNGPAAVLALAVLEAMSTGWEHKDRPFVPDWTIRPGVMLREALKAKGKSADDILGARRIIDGTLRIGPFEAGTIAAALGTTEDMWLNAQRLYDAALLRGATDTSDEHEQDAAGDPECE